MIETIAVAHTYFFVKDQSRAEPLSKRGHWKVESTPYDGEELRYQYSLISGVQTDPPLRGIARSVRFQMLHIHHVSIFFDISPRSLCSSKHGDTAPLFTKQKTYFFIYFWSPHSLCFNDTPQRFNVILRHWIRIGRGNTCPTSEYLHYRMLFRRVIQRKSKETHAPAGMSTLKNICETIAIDDYLPIRFLAHCRESTW